jgi:hypothetical protein
MEKDCMKRSIIAVLLLLVGTLGTVHAQDGGGLTGDQRAALNVVNKAITTMISQESYRVTQQSTMTQDTTQLNDNLPVRYANDYTFTVGAQFDAEQQLASAQGKLTSHSTNSIGETSTSTALMAFSAEFNLADGTLYERFELPTEYGLSTLLSGQWIALSHDEYWAALKNEYGLNAMGLQLGLTRALNPREQGGYTVNGLPTGPLPDAALIDIQELDSAALDGQSMRVFELTLDPLYWMVEGMKASPLTNADPTADLDAATIQALRAWLRERVNDRQTIWIGADDHLIHRIETSSVGSYNTGDMREDIPALAEGEAWSTQVLTITFDNTNTVTFSAFGVPVEIAAPDDAVPFGEQFERND